MRARVLSLGIGALCLAAGLLVAPERAVSAPAVVQSGKSCDSLGQTTMETNGAGIAACLYLSPQAVFDKCTPAKPCVWKSQTSPTVNDMGNFGIGTVVPGSDVWMAGGLTLNGAGDTQFTVQRNGVSGFALNVLGGGKWYMYDKVGGTWNTSFASDKGNIYMPNELQVGSIGVGGFAANAGFPPGWAAPGRIHAGDIYSEWTVGAGQGGSLDAYLNSVGTVFGKQFCLGTTANCITVWPSGGAGCPEGQVLLGTTCTTVPSCAAGTVLTFSGAGFSCVSITPVAGVVCPAGQVLLGTTCTAVPSCAANQVLKFSGAAFSCVAGGDCPAGQVKLGNTCMPIPDCPNALTYSPYWGFGCYVFDGGASGGAN